MLHGKTTRLIVAKLSMLPCIACYCFVTVPFAWSKHYNVDEGTLVMSNNFYHVLLDVMTY